MFTGTGTWDYPLLTSLLTKFTTLSKPLLVFVHEHELLTRNIAITDIKRQSNMNFSFFKEDCNMQYDFTSNV